MDLSPSREATSRSARVHFRVYKSPLMVPIQSQINPVHATPSYLSKIHFNVNLPSTHTCSLPDDLNLPYMFSPFSEQITVELTVDSFVLFSVT
jgi:hypothetical protein